MSKASKERDAYLEFCANKRIVVPEVGFDPGELSGPMVPFQRSATRTALKRGRCALFEECGLGKAQPKTEPVLTPTGWRAIGELSIGDEIISQDGTVTKVNGVFPQGERDIVKVTFNDDTSALCDLEHLWNIKSDSDVMRNRPWRTVATSAIIKSGLLAASTRTTLNWRIPVVEPIAFSHKELPIQPYVMGVLLGDGCFRHGRNISFTKPDKHIHDKVLNLLPSGVILHKKPHTGESRATFWLRGIAKETIGLKNPVYIALEKEGLVGKLSSEKWIPKQYLLGSIEQRSELLRGMLDTDGYASKDGYTIQYSSSSKQLSDDFCSLVRSLGGVTWTSDKIPTYTYKGEKLAGLRHYTTTVSLPPGIVPFSLPRKLNLCTARTKYFPYRKIASIIQAGKADCVCISVEHESKLYVTSDFIVTHNTIQSLTFAHEVAIHTGGKSLILAPLAVSKQTVREGDKFGLPIKYAQNQDQVDSRVTITNYERLASFDAKQFDCVVLDESSVLKHFASATKKNIIEAFKTTPYKLPCSATPAPNDHMELGNHSEFLNVLPSNEMLARWFINDTSHFGKYRLKGHAVREFWDWVSSWAIMAGKPSDISPEFDDSQFNLPELHVIEHCIEVDVVTGRTDGMLIRIPEMSSTSVHKERRMTLEARVAKVAELIAKEPDEQWLVWAETDYEADALAESIHGLVDIKGSHSVDKKEEALLGFTTGNPKWLLTKPKIAGLGMNFQNCARMACVSSTFSFESWYQSTRRCWRFGQLRPVDLHMIFASTEQSVMNILNHKRKEFLTMQSNMLEAARRRQHAKAGNGDYVPSREMSIPNWLKSEISL